MTELICTMILIALVPAVAALTVLRSKTAPRAGGLPPVTQSEPKVPCLPPAQAPAPQRERVPGPTPGPDPRNGRTPRALRGSVPPTEEDLRRLQAAEERRARRGRK
jgi:hypothetical protein